MFMKFLTVLLLVLGVNQSEATHPPTSIGNSSFPPTSSGNFSNATYHPTIGGDFSFPPTSSGNFSNATYHPTISGNFSNATYHPTIGGDFSFPPTTSGNSSNVTFQPTSSGNSTYHPTSSGNFSYHPTLSPVANASVSGRISSDKATGFLGDGNTMTYIGIGGGAGVLVFAVAGVIAAKQRRKRNSSGQVSANGKQNGSVVTNPMYDL